MQQEPAEAAPYRVLSFYKFCWLSEAERETLMAWLRSRCTELNLLGRLYVAHEGLNGTLCGAPAASAAFQEALHGYPGFQEVLFKEEPAWEPAFYKLIVRKKREIVAFRAPQPVDPVHNAGEHVPPEELQRILEDPPEDVVLFDARSSYEYAVGHFTGALHLDVENFRELPERLEALAPYRDKTIITYCTGGIKCEKLTAYMKQAGFADVRQLQGGIQHYAAVTGGENFAGKCYVFDRRTVIPVNRVNPSVVGRCHVCNQPGEWAVNCANKACHDRVLLCESCAEVYQGSCSVECYHAPDRRPWNGTGRYERITSGYFTGTAPLQKRGKAPTLPVTAPEEG